MTAVCDEVDEEEDVAIDDGLCYYRFIHCKFSCTGVHRVMMYSIVL